MVIIGAGPAGLATCLTTAHRALTTLVIEAKDKPGGQPQFLYADKRIVDVPGFPDGISGEELSERTYRQAVNALVQFRFSEELIHIEDTAEVEAEDPLKRVVTSKSSYLCRKVIIACGLLHYPRRLAVLDQLNSKNVHYKVPKIGDYEGGNVAVVGGGDSALDAALMVLGRGGKVDLIVREASPIGKPDSLARVQDAGGILHTSTEIDSAEFAGEQIRLRISDIIQSDLFARHQRADRLSLGQGHLRTPWTPSPNEDSNISIDPYFETSRTGIFAVGDVHGDIKLIAVTGPRAFKPRSTPSRKSPARTG